MKICLYIFFTLCPLFFVYSSDLPFKYNYELYGIDNLTDQAIISAPNGDDYFFGIEKEQIVSKFKSSDSDVFLDYIPDFSYHNFDSITELAREQIDNQSDVLVFIGEEKNTPSINIMTFNKEFQLKYRENFKIYFSSTDVITDLQVMCVDRYIVKIIYIRNDVLYTYELDTSLNTNTYNEKSTDLKGQILKIIDNITVIKNVDKFELWYVGINDDDLRIKYLKPLEQIEAESIKVILAGNGCLIMMTNGEYDTYLNIDSETLLIEELTIPIDIKIKLYKLDGEYTYGVKVDDKIINIKNFYEYTDINNIEIINPDSYYSEDSFLLFYNIEKEIYTYTNLRNQTKYDFKIPNLNRSILIDDYLTVLISDGAINKYKRYYLGWNKVFELTDNPYFSIEEDIYLLNISNDSLNLNDSFIYYTSCNNQFIYSESIPVVDNDFVLYKQEGLYSLGLGGYDFE